MKTETFESYRREWWNIFDQLMYLVLLFAFILRLASVNEAARHVYTIDLIMFYLRILQLYYFHKRLGPKVVVIWRMVCTVMCPVPGFFFITCSSAQNMQL